MNPEREPDELQLTHVHRWAALDRFPLYAALIVGATFLIGLALGNIRLPMPTRYSFRTDIGPPPTVEPMLFRNVDQATARKTNQSVPVTKLPVPAAPAFLFKGSPESFARATDCLAATIFYEAGAETTAGQMAVVQVVLNRARHPAYPKTVCGVVFQGQERKTGCQFSYTCDGSMVRRPSLDAWSRFRSLAAAMLKGMVYAPVGTATHYHTDWVLPAWSAKLDKVRIEGTHLFFRYAGYWGTREAMHGRMDWVEPSIGKMKGLSAAHGGTELAEEVAKEADLAKLSEAMASADLERISTTLDSVDSAKEIFLIYVDPLLDSSALTGMAESACGSRKTCKVFAWADQALMPRGLPLDPNDRAAMAYSYIRTAQRSTALQKWNCGLFPRESKRDCL